MNGVLKGSLSWLLVLIVSASVMGSSRIALAHSGEWRWVPSCAWGFCIYRLQWQAHQHKDDREEAYKQCRDAAHEQYFQALYRIDKSGASDEKKAKQRELAARMLRIKLEDCETRRKTGE